MDKKRVEQRYQQLLRDAEAGGYTLNADREFCMNLTEGMLVNQDRYGIEACPCRLVMGDKEANRDIVCPCNYREADLAEFGACFCALYVNEQFDPDVQVPERRPSRTEREKSAQQNKQGLSPTGELAYPVWRCEVCGYLCANIHPPAKCPICKVGKERFSQFM